MAYEVSYPKKVHRYETSDGCTFESETKARQREAMIAFGELWDKNIADPYEVHPDQVIKFITDKRVEIAAIVEIMKLRV